MNAKYLVIADNEIKTTASKHERAQQLACNWSQGRFEQAKVVYLPNNTVQGIWFKGMRLA